MKQKHFMERITVAFVGMLLVTEAAFGQPTAMWHLDEGGQGEVAIVLRSEINGEELQGKAGVHGKGIPPVFEASTPAAKIWDGGTCSIVNPNNRTSLRFFNDGVSGSLAPVGGEMIVSGIDPKTHMADLTVEAFVRMKRQMPHHVLIASKRRNGQAGVSWSLSLDPTGTVRARFDTQTEAAAMGKTKGFNQLIGSTGSMADGEWHHVALTFDRATRAVAIYVDYEKYGKGVTAGPLVYDKSVLVFGRGLDGWLDEIRLTPEVLHPEQFLRMKPFFSELKSGQQQPISLDQTHSRVQSALQLDLKRIGTLIPKSVHEIGTSMWSLGCETLDRDLADWNAYKGYLEALGIKRIRLQGGWNRSEKKKGEYDFEWLDKIVDDAIARGLEVCLETSYNNRLYEPRGALGPGGELPAGEETLAAWDKWVEAMVRRYSAKGVKEWMMYNEPNLNKANTPERIISNNIRTAEIIKRVDPEAKIGAFVLAGLSMNMLEKLLVEVNKQGKSSLFHWVIYHGYSGNPDRLNVGMKDLNVMMKRLAPNLQVWQGEAGCASEEVQYALSGIAWTEYSQAKWNARRMLCDIGHDVESTVFTISDLSYHKDFISRYGLLKTNPDNSIIKIKTAYYTVQNVVSVFNDALDRVPDYSLAIEGTEKELTWFAFRDKQRGLDVLTLWDGTELPGNESDLGLVNVTIKNGRFETPVWVDMITGNVYEIPEKQVVREGDTIQFKRVPVYDGPGVITDRSLLKFEPAREKKGNVKKQRKTVVSVPKMKKFLLAGTQQPAPAVLIAGSADGAAIAMAKWLNGQDIHAFIVEIADKRSLREAFIYVKSRAAEWQVKTDALGVMALRKEQSVIALAAEADINFTVWISTGDEEKFDKLPGLKPEALFVGKKDSWKTPLAAFLEKHKGKVF